MIFYCISVTLGRDDGTRHAQFVDTDNSYAEARGYAWEKFMNAIQFYATKVPYMIGVGNRKWLLQYPTVAHARMVLV